MKFKLEDLVCLYYDENSDFLINSFIYRILMTSRGKYNISFLRDEGVTNGIRAKGYKNSIKS